MYVASITIRNFRCLPNETIRFKSGFNLLVGPNDSGKTAIVDALRLALSTKTEERLSVVDGDFHNEGQDILIEVEIKFADDKEASWFAEWLTWHNDGSCALNLYCTSNRSSRSDYYYFKRTAGPSLEKSKDIDIEALDRLRAVYLKPIRDSSAELSASNVSRLARILAAHSKVNNSKKEILDGYKTAAEAINKMFEELGTLHPSTTAIVNTYFQSFHEALAPQAKIGFRKTGNTSDKHLKTVLQKFELWTDDHLPGLGTANALFMAAELMLLEDIDLGCLKVALVEELEAHIHPTRQLKIVKALQQECNEKAIQIIATSHSPNLASKVKIENLLLCHNGHVFSFAEGATALSVQDYKYLERFLDVTKSSIFFSRGLIFVEGVTEQFMVPAFARLLGLDLTDNGVSVINVSNLGFDRFANAFRRQDEPANHIPVAVVTDADQREAEVVQRVTIRKNDDRNKIRWFYGLSIDQDPLKTENMKSVTLEKIILYSDANKLRKIYEFCKPGKAMLAGLKAYDQIKKKKGILAQEASIFIDKISSSETLTTDEQALGVDKENLEAEVRRLFPNIVSAIYFACGRQEDVEDADV